MNIIDKFAMWQQFTRIVWQYPQIIDTLDNELHFRISPFHAKSKLATYMW